MNRRQRSAGFTLIELLISFAILMTLVLLIAPSLARFIQRSKLMGAAQQTAMVMRIARSQSVKLSAVTVVKQQPTTKPPSVLWFIDLDGDSVKDANEKTEGSVLLERGIQFEPSVGLSPDPAGASLPPLAIFQQGNAANPGAYRFIDSKTNEMEVELMSAAPFRVEVRKKEGAAWITNGEGGKAWTWK